MKDTPVICSPYHYNELLKRCINLVSMEEPGSTCDICVKVYKQHLLKLRHQASAHGMTKLLPHTCSFCNKKYLEHKNLKIHLQQKHNCTVATVFTDPNLTL